MTVHEAQGRQKHTNNEAAAIITAGEACLKKQPHLGEILQTQDVVLAVALQHPLALHRHIVVLVMDGGLRH